MKSNFHQLQLMNWKPELETIVRKVLPPIGILAESPPLKKFRNGLKVSTERLDFSSLKRKYILTKIDIKKINVDLILENSVGISPYIKYIVDNYSRFYWVIDFIEKTLDSSCLFHCKLEVDEKSQKVTILNGGRPKIIYKYQSNFISEEDLNKENQKFISKGIVCRWFFGQEAENKVSENWSYYVFGEYLYFIDFKNLFDARKLIPKNSVGLPINLNEEGAIIRKAIYE